MLLNPLNNKNGCYVYILSSIERTQNLFIAEIETRHGVHLPCTCVNAFSIAGDT